jgi:hypothetical protein
MAGWPFQCIYHVGWTPHARIEVKTNPMKDLYWEKSQYTKKIPRFKYKEENTRINT